MFLHVVSNVCTVYKSAWSVTILLCCKVCWNHCSACFALLFASLLQGRLRPLLNPSRGPHGDERALCDSETPYIGEKGRHEANGTMEWKGPIKAKEPTAVKGSTEGKLKFFSYSRAKNCCTHYLKPTWQRVGSATYMPQSSGNMHVKVIHTKLDII